MLCNDIKAHFGVPSGARENSTIDLSSGYHRSNEKDESKWATTSTGGIPTLGQILET